MVPVNGSIHTIAHRINISIVYFWMECRPERDRGRREPPHLHSLTCIFDEVHDDHDHENEATTTTLFIAVC